MDETQALSAHERVQRALEAKRKRPLLPTWDEQLSDFDRGLLKVFGIGFNQLDKKAKEG